MKSLQQLDPNYVIILEYSKDNLAQLLAELSIRGLDAVTRPGSDSTKVLVFTRVDVERAKNDDLYSISQNLPFIIFQTPIYDQTTTKRLERLLNKATKKEILATPTEKELIEFALLTGNSEQSLYFAFLRYYIHWLIPLAVIGITIRLCCGGTIPWEFNKLYTLCLLSWSILFTSHWVYKRKGYFISKFGGIHKSTLFQERFDTVQSAKHSKVILRKCCFIPIALFFVMLLVSFQLLCFLLEILITQLYSGPLVMILSLLPTILISTFTPILTMVYNKFFVDKFVHWENGSNPRKSTMEKNFILTFFISYMPLIITLFLYLPFGYKFSSESRNELAKICSKFHIPLTESAFVINVKRYKDQILYFTLTNQIMAIAMEDLTPFVLHILNIKMSGKDKSATLKTVRNIIKTKYPKDEEIWDYVNNLQTNEWGEFNFDENIKKLVIQFGYISMFSVIWPLSPLFFVIFDILILKLDLWRSIKKSTPVSFPNNTESPEVEDNFKSSESPLDSWNLIIEFILFISLIIGPTLTLMYSNCKLPNVGYHNTFEKRDLWYTFYPFQYSWSTILAFAVFMEHFGIISYFIVCKVLIATQETPNIGHIPVNTLQLPQKTNLLNVALETNKYMDKEKNILKEKNIDIPKRSSRRPSVNSITEKEAENTKDIFKFSDNTPPSSPKKVRQKSEGDYSEDEIIHSPPKFKRVLESSRIIQNREIENKKSTIAGATLPDNIPTSKNYHIRNGLKGDGMEMTGHDLIKGEINHTEKVLSDKNTKRKIRSSQNEGPNERQILISEEVKDISPKGHDAVHKLGNQELATKAAATVVKADRDAIPITPLAFSHESPDEKENEVVVPLSNIANIRNSLSLRRKSVVSSKSNKSNKSNKSSKSYKSNNSNQGMNMEDTQDGNIQKSTDHHIPTPKGIFKKIKNKI